MGHECVIDNTQSKGKSAGEKVDNNKELYERVSTIPCWRVVSSPIEEIEQRETCRTHTGEDSGERGRERERRREGGRREGGREERGRKESGREEREGGGRRRGTGRYNDYTGH